MCGVIALLKTPDHPCPAATLYRARDTVSHRGPDDAGAAFFTANGQHLSRVPDSDAGWVVGLGHRRLSILDLSRAGHQPMAYRRRFWVVYNGEVYNYVELRRELERLDHRFQSCSDTEVMLAAYAEWGPGCFSRFRGMWGLSLLDTERREVILSRDRLGIKPLYLWQGQGILAVASEIKQLLEVPGFKPRLEVAAAAQFLQTGYEQLSRTFFADVFPVPPGTYVRISLDSLRASEAEPYWFPERVGVSINDPVEAGRLFAAKLEETVRQHLRSDVPVGSALSGGMDSSSIAVLVQRVRGADSQPLHTFTSTYPGEAIDEREYVDAVQAGLGCVPHFVTPSAEQFLEDFARFVWTHDEPVGSFSVYAGYCVARITRAAGVPVTLNGQGGDEILSGYWQCYFLYLRELFRECRLAALVGHLAGALGPGGNGQLWRQLPVMLRRYRARTRAASIIKVRHAPPSNGHGALATFLEARGQGRRVREIREFFLPRLLKWEDRNSMAFSVEGRYPFLDHELIELCLSFAPHTLYTRGWTKRPLRLGLRDVLPAKIVRRRSKLGFETPQDRFLAGPMRAPLEAWLTQDRPVWELVANEEARDIADAVWNRQHSGEEWGQALFRLFVFDHWLETFGVGI